MQNKIFSKKTFFCKNSKLGFFWVRIPLGDQRKSFEKKWLAAKKVQWGAFKILIFKLENKREKK
jgi:hypothetical protein